MTEESGRTAQDTTDKLVRKLTAQIADSVRDVKDLSAELANVHAERALRGHTSDHVLLTPHVAKHLTVARDKAGKFVTHVLERDKKTIRLTEKSNSTAPMGVDEFVAEMKSKGPFSEHFGGETSTTRAPGTKQTTTSSGEFQISAEDAQDTVKYRQIRKQAMEAGETVQIVSE